MTKATRKDKSRVVEILVRSFESDPHTNWLVRADEKGKDKRLKALMDFAFEDSILHDRVYLSNDRTGAALWKTGAAAGFSFARTLSQLRFAFAFGLKRTRAVLAMEKYVKTFQPPGNYLYLWFIGVLPAGRGIGIASELLDPVLEECSREGLPVYLQTANPKNVPLYEQKGFSEYHLWTPADDTGLRVWFMRKDN